MLSRVTTHAQSLFVSRLLSGWRWAAGFFLTVSALIFGLPSRGAETYDVPDCNPGSLAIAINQANFEGGTINLKPGCTYTFNSSTALFTALPRSPDR